MKISRDLYWLNYALKLAEKAASLNEVPVGAVLVLNDQIIGEGYNCPISTQDGTAHAEIIALRKAAAFLNNYRLVNATLYVTLEPCLMCAGAMVHARIDSLIYGAFDPKSGVVQSQAQLLDAPYLNHKIKYQGGLMAKECGDILKNFFKNKR